VSALFELTLLLQAVFNTVRGRYPLTVQEYHSQAGLQSAVKVTEDNSKAVDLKAEVNSFYPPHLRTNRGGIKVTKLFKKSTETKSLSDELMTAHQEALKKCKDPHQLKILYLQHNWHKPYYASVFFKGVVEKSSQYLLKLLTTSERHVVVAINTECIHIMTVSIPSVSAAVPGVLCGVFTWVSVSDCLHLRAQGSSGLVHY